MKPYPRYKPTGLAWLPSVPEHWEATKIRTIFTERTTKVSDKDYPPLSVSKGGVVPQIETVAKSDDSDNRKLVRIGDFVINSRSDRKGSSGVSELDGSVSLVNLVLKPRKKGNGRFLHYLLKSDPFVEEFYRNGHGIVADLWTTRYSEMKSIYIPLPPPSEQDRIVRYLDEKTAAIDELVRAKEREIDLLRERKQALVSAAVTGGLDPATERKDSGDPFTGYVPKSWQAIPLNSCSRVVSKLGIPGSELLSVFLNRGVVKFSDMEEKRANATSLDLTNYQQVEPGDLVLNNQQAWRGSVGVSKLSGIVSPAYVVAKLDETWDLDFANYFFRAPHMVAHYVVASKGVGSIQRIIDWNEMKHVKVFRPDKAEQKQIADQLGLACKRFDSLETACRKQISLLQELRTRLVSDAVTGAVEV